MDNRSRVANLAAITLLIGAAGFVALQFYQFVSVRLLLEGAKQGRERAVARLLQMGPDAVGPLLSLLDDPEPTPRVYAAMLLGDIGCPTATAGLTESLDDPNPTVRSEAALALGRVGDPRAVPALVRALKDPAATAAAASSLGRLRASEAVPELALLVGAGNEHVRSRSAWALAAIGGDAAIKALRAALARRNLAAVVGAHRFFIAEGIAGSEPVLVAALRSDLSTPWMAACYLDCGNATLAAAARSWEASRLDRTRRLRSYSRAAPRWGSGSFSEAQELGPDTAPLSTAGEG